MAETAPVRPRGLIARSSVVLILVLVIGATVGGFLDYRAWHAVAAFEAAIPVLLAIIVAIVAGILWVVRRRPLAGLVALAALVFIIGLRIGAWVAPSAHGPDWSPGTVALDLRDPALGTASGQASCLTSSDNSFSVNSDPAQSLAGTTVSYSLSGPGPAGDIGPYFDLFTSPGSGEGPRWDTNVEGDTTYSIQIDGQASAGSATLVEIPRAADSPTEGGFTGAVPDAISGVMTWTCEPPRGEPTPIEGTWFE